VLCTYLEYNTVVRLCHFFFVAGKLILYKFSCSIQIFILCWFWREIVFDVTYVLSVQYSCAVVSFFVVVAVKLILYKYVTVTIVSQNIKNFLCKKMIPYKTYVQEDQLFLALYGTTTIQSLLFLKNIKNFV
jgi:hypothetical protein